MKSESKPVTLERKKKRVSCLIITEHFEGIEKVFFQAEIRYSTHKKKMRTTKKQI